VLLAAGAGAGAAEVDGVDPDVVDVSDELDDADELDSAGIDDDFPEPDPARASLR